MSLAGNLTAIGVLASVFGGAWYGVQPQPKSEMAGLEDGEHAASNEVYLPIDFIAIPLIRSEKIEGYLMARFSVQTNKDAISRYGDALPLYVQHVINKGLYAAAEDFEGNNTYSIFDEVSGKLVAEINDELGAGTVAHIYPGQLDVFAKDAVRTPRDGFNPG